MQTQNETWQATDHYDKKGKTVHTVRLMTFEEVCSLSYGCKVVGRKGSVLDVKINGAPKRWKTRPQDVDVLVKYGFYEYSYIKMRDGVYLSDSVQPVIILETKVGA